MRRARLLLAIAAASAALVATAPLQAGARQPSSTAGPPPAAAQQTGGVVRFTVGRASVWALADGYIQGSYDLLHGVTRREAERLLRRAGEARPPRLSLQAFMVDVDGERVLVDTGAAGMFGPTTGRLADSLRAAGVDPASIRHVVISHMHGDHVGGLLDAEGRPRFPNAQVHVDAAEAAYWTSHERRDAATENRNTFDTAARVAQAYGDRLRPFTGRTEIVRGFVAEPAPGHTPGHALYRLTSLGSEMLFVGDLVHVGAVQFARPTVTLAFDGDEAAARSQRLAVLRGLGRSVLVAGPHLPWPGVGRLSRRGSGYRWTPATPASR